MKEGGPGDFQVIHLFTNPLETWGFSATPEGQTEDGEPGKGTPKEGP